jgi:hypothetical protein
MVSSWLLILQTPASSVSNNSDNFAAGIVCFALTLVNRTSTGAVCGRLAFDKLIPLVLNVHRER